ncbi:hypothetical protein NPIL_638651 [Nephila pilipes]|uniref:sn-1-specific diacylglycerol lipase ABHD11 n=1 Tax=Nephila pilipes TaxID=299642 RepID=A0A8X6TUA4_NEPPI|nr:hypothetical protein NPIL_638651 [Nephila pilipes]
MKSVSVELLFVRRRSRIKLRCQKMRLAYDVYLPPGEKEENLPPIIFLHGMMDSRKTWKYIAPAVAKRTGRKVYAIDARNHGESPRSDEITFNILSEDLHDFLTQHNIRKAALVGHSMGGRTALTLALTHPEKVEKLIVEDMGLMEFRPSKRGPILYLAQLLKDSLEQIPRDVDEATAKQAIVEHMKPLFAGNTKSQLIDFKIDLDMIPLKKENGNYVWQTNLKAIEDWLKTDKIRQRLHGVWMGDALFIYGTESFFKINKDPRILECFPRATKLGFEDCKIQSK